MAEKSGRKSAAGRSRRGGRGGGDGEPLWIRWLGVTNVMRVRVVQFAPDRNTVVISGPNNAGKSTILESIVMAIGGGKFTPPVPVRKGETRGTIEMELSSGLKIIRDYEDGKERLRLLDNGQPVTSSPQRVLDAFFDRHTFDLMGFLGMSPLEQRRTLLKFLGIEAEMGRLESERRKILDERKGFNLTLNAAREQRYDLPSLPGDFQRSETHWNIGQLSEELSAAEAAVRTLENRRGELERLRDKEQETLDQIRALQEKLEKVRVASEALARDLSEDEMNAPDPEPVRRKLAQAQEHNRWCDVRDQQDECDERVNAAESELRALDGRLSENSDAHKDLLSNVKWPLEGLSFGEDGLEYDGLPLVQASQSERIRVACAVCGASDKPLKVLRIRDGSLLDDESFAAIDAHVREFGLQVFVECVGERGRPGEVIIEDGEIKEQVGQ